MTGVDGPREAGQGGQASIRQRIVHPYSTYLEDFLNKTSKDAGNILLGKYVTTVVFPASSC